MHAKELIAIFEAAAAKRPIQRMLRRIQLDKYPLIRRAVRGASGADHPAKFRPVFSSPLRPAGKRHGRAVHAEQTAATIDELQQALSQLRVFKQVSHRIVEKHGVELPQMLRLKDLRVAADDRLKGSRLRTHPLKRQVGVEARWVSRIADIDVVDQ